MPSDSARRDLAVDDQLDALSQTSPSQTSPSEASLSETSGRLVEHLTAQVVLLRAVQHRLAQDDLSEVEMRQVLGQLFASSAEAMGTARAFDESIRRLEASSIPVTPGALMGDENVLATLAGIVGAMESASELVAADLAAVDAFVSILEENLRIREGVEPPDFAALELIRALASNAVDRLDLARPPHDAANVFSDLHRLIEHFAGAPESPASVTPH